MSLNKILAEMNEVRPYATENVDEGPYETINARRGRKRQAEERLKSLREQYVQDLLRSSLFILVTGSSKDEFTTLASEKYGCFSADPEGFYKDLAGRIPEALVGKESPSSLFDVLGRHLEDMAGEMGVLGYPQLIFKQTYEGTVTNKAEFLQLVKTAINDQVGGEMAGIHAVRSVADTAIEKGHTNAVTPIVLGTSDEKLAIQLSEALERLTPRVFVVTAGKSSKALKAVSSVSVKEATEESVEEALATIRSNLKK